MLTLSNLIRLEAGQCLPFRVQHTHETRCIEGKVQTGKKVLFVIAILIKEIVLAFHSLVM